jgi:hypothetical protein
MSDFLTHVLPPEGWYCIIGLKDSLMPKQEFADSLTGALALVENYKAAGRDVYFGCAKYADKGNRTKNNASFFKAFWLDIDCGVGKPYATQGDGVAALQIFCAANTLPKPTIVNSGRGIHVYWTLQGTIHTPEWHVVADKLKQLCNEQKLYADDVVTADAARILRVPGSYNHKDPTNPQLVSVLYQGKDVDYEAFRQLIGAASTASLPLAKRPAFIPRQGNALTKALTGNIVSWFAPIMQKSLKGEGCNQLAYIVANQETMTEPLWRAALSVAQHCEDRDEAIHKISSRHPGYSPEDTEIKARRIKGPYRCSTFSEYNPAGCDGCIHKGKIHNPIVLGQDIRREEPEVVAEGEAGGEAPKNVEFSRTLPFPFFRGANGGIYREVPEEKPKLVYEHDLIVVKRLLDPGTGECALIRCKLPMEGWKEFAIPLALMTSKDDLRKTIAVHGILASAKGYEDIMAYLITAVKDLQVVLKAEEMRKQFGWADDDTKFITGESEVNEQGVVYSPPSAATIHLAGSLQAKGDFHVWKDIFNTYAAPGFEPHAFAALTAYGSTLYKFMDLKGCLINLVHNTSGTGKSTILRVANSVSGHPDDLMLNWRDTYNSIIHRAGIMNNHLLTIDEITKLKADIFSELVYSVTQGRGSNRMRRDKNEERMNDTTWSNFWLCSANASFVDKLRTLKATPDGELMRLFEYDIMPTTILTKLQATAIFGGLANNYGHGMIPFMQYVVPNLNNVVTTIKKVQDKIDLAVGLTGRERFWSGLCASVIGAGLITNNLGLNNYDMKRIYSWVITTVKDMRSRIEAPEVKIQDVIGEFVLKYHSNVLVVNGKADLRNGLLSPPVVEPKGELLIRYEPDTKELALSQRKFRAFCTENQITLSDVIDQAKREGILLAVKKKHMTKGTRLVSTPTDVVVFDAGGFNLGLAPEPEAPAAEASV